MSFLFGLWFIITSFLNDKLFILWFPISIQVVIDSTTLQLHYLNGCAHYALFEWMLNEPPHRISFMSRLSVLKSMSAAFGVCHFTETNYICFFNIHPQRRRLSVLKSMSAAFGVCIHFTETKHICFFKIHTQRRR